LTVLYLIGYKIHMKRPVTPPDIDKWEEYLENYVKAHTPHRVMVLYDWLSKASQSGAYLHWDEFRFRRLPEDALEGMSKEVYWLAMKIGRRNSRRYIPFESKNTNAPPFSFSHPDCLLAGLRHIDVKSAGSVSTSREAISPMDTQRYMVRSILEEPFSSSVLEGAATTRLKAKEIIEKGVKPKTNDERMVLNNYHAMVFIKEHKDDVLTPELVLECHRIITEGTLARPEMAGCLRNSNDVVVGDDYGEVFHVPPDYRELAARLELLCDFANGDEDGTGIFIHPITKAIILHFMLAYDHPFVDGNGRVARALFYWSVLRSGYWLLEYISISKIIKQAPARYGRAFLYTETDENDLTYFILHQIDVIKRAIAELEVYLERQKQNYQKLIRILDSEGLNHRQMQTLEDFVKGRIGEITIGQYEQNFRVSYLTARKDLDELKKRRFLGRTQRGRTYYYRPGSRLADLRREQRNSIF